VAGLFQGGYCFGLLAGGGGEGQSVEGLVAALLDPKFSRKPLIWAENCPVAGRGSAGDALHKSLQQAIGSIARRDLVVSIIAIT
jgi:hypothetical protein